MDTVGKEGVIQVEESNTFGIELETVEGMRFDKGIISPRHLQVGRGQGPRVRRPPQGHAR